VYEGKYCELLRFTLRFLPLRETATDEVWCRAVEAKENEAFDDPDLF